jgi:predicted histidine transporter YuiF (NhaC family)
MIKYFIPAFTKIICFFISLMDIICPSNQHLNMNFKSNQVMLIPKLELIAGLVSNIYTVYKDKQDFNFYPLQNIVWNAV